jgi:plasmid maintenance system killer protein
MRVQVCEISRGSLNLERAPRRAGQHSIRINEQYRVCFRWEDGYADEVEVINYH